jgi:hypothetical protein
MKIRPMAVAILLCVAVRAVLGQTPPQAVSADSVVVNAKIYTLNPRQPWAEALAVRGEKILAVGSAREIDHYRVLGPR